MKNSRLGRGLSALIPDDLRDNIQSPSGDKFNNAKLVPIHSIRPNPEQPRMHFDELRLNELAESIENHGILTALLVKRDGPNRYILIAGERRLRAAGLAGLEFVPVIIREQVSDKLQLELALVENIQREDLDPIETAAAYQRLLNDFNMTQADVGKRVGKDRATVANTVRLLKLPLFFQGELRAGRISPGHCKALLTLGEESLQRQVLDKIYEQDMTVRQAESLVKSMMEKNFNENDAGLNGKKTLSSISKSLGAKVKLEQKKSSRKGKIVIEFNSAQEFRRICEKLLNAEKKES